MKALTSTSFLVGRLGWPLLSREEDVKRNIGLAIPSQLLTTCGPHHAMLHSSFRFLQTCSLNMPTALLSLKVLVSRWIFYTWEMGGRIITLGHFLSQTSPWRAALQPDPSLSSLLFLEHLWNGLHYHCSPEMWSKGQVGRYFLEDLQN